MELEAKLTLKFSVSLALDSLVLLVSANAALSTDTVETRQTTARLIATPFMESAVPNLQSASPPLPA